MTSICFKYSYVNINVIYNDKNKFILIPFSIKSWLIYSAMCAKWLIKFIKKLTKRLNFQTIVTLIDIQTKKNPLNLTCTSNFKAILRRRELPERFHPVEKQKFVCRQGPRRRSPFVPLRAIIIIKVAWAKGTRINNVCGERSYEMKIRKNK